MPCDQRLTLPELRELSRRMRRRWLKGPPHCFLGTNVFDAEDFSVYSLARRRPMAQRPRRANALTNGPQALHTRRSMIWVWYLNVPEDLGGKEHNSNG